MSRKLQNLTSKDLEIILSQWEDSEDGLDFSDDDEAVDPTLEANMDESSDEELEASRGLQNELEPTNNLPNASTSSQRIRTTKDFTSVTASHTTITEESSKLSNRVPKAKPTR